MRSAIFLFGLMLASIILAQHISSKAEAAQNIRFGNGYYINLSGAGADTNGNIGGYNDEADCNTGSGTCTAKNRNNGQNYDGGTVYKYVCSGLVTNCDNTHAPGRVTSSTSGYSQSIDGGLGCDQTVQLDVFDRNNVLHGYMTWYSGACSQNVQNTNNITVCSGRVVSQAQLESELRGAGYPGPWGDVNIELQAFNRAACPSGDSATPAPTYTVTTCNGRTLSQSQLESELRGANYPGPWGDINTELQAFNRAACPRYATPQPTAAPAYGGTTTYYIYQTPYPTPTPQTIYKTNIKHAAYSAPTPTAYPKPQTQTYQSKGGTLPQTGSSVANFLYFVSLVPAGLLLKKLGSVVS